MPSPAELHLRACRVRMGRSALGTSVPTTIGHITLRPDQREAVARVRRQLDRWRGCLLADDVGRGKTYVALTVAQHWSRVVVVVPASLRETWAEAMRRSGVEYPIITHEALSRGLPPGRAWDGVIVDESHHFRNIGARRYGALAALTAHAEVLMLSATPIQNAARDLAAQLAIFLGSGAMARTSDTLVRHVVRVELSAVDASLPIVLAPRWRTVGVDDADVLRAILELPPPPRALDAGDAGALRTMSLVRAWASSRAALASTLARRRRSVIVIEQSLDDGRLPTRAELRRWYGGDDACMQLGFASLLVAGRPSEGLASLRDAVRVEQGALDALATLLRDRADVDHHRARLLATIADEHSGERVIAFTGFASTARAYYALLRARPRVALLTAGDARIASGRITRRELVARFAPCAQGFPEPPARERIALLVSTDLLSEGVNLQDAGVVIHLDLPWNPARLAQRVGRLRRPHGCATVAAYLIAPPADAALLLGVEARLRRKLAVASRAIGSGVDVVPALSPNGAAHCADVGPGLAAVQDAVDSRLARWARAPAPTQPVDERLLVAGVHGDTRGWLALLSDGRLLASEGRAIGDDAEMLDRMLRAAEGAARTVHLLDVTDARTALSSHLEANARLADCGLADSPSPLAHAVERRLGLLQPRAARHARPAAFALASTLRSALTRPMSLGIERALLQWLARESSMNAFDWLEGANAIVGRASRNVVRVADAPPVPIALILVSSADAVGA